MTLLEGHFHVLPETEPHLVLGMANVLNRNQNQVLWIWSSRSFPLILDIASTEHIADVAVDENRTPAKHSKPEHNNQSRFMLLQ